MSKSKNIAVVGLGYVGLPLAILAARKGYCVTGIDINEKRITDLQKNGDALCAEVGMSKAGVDIEFTTDFSRLKEASVVIVCVPTPVLSDHIPDLTPVEKAAENVGTHLQPGQLVVLESTVNPEITEGFFLPILEAKSGLVGGQDFYLAHAPERINPGDPKWNVENINRVVGALEPIGLEKAVAFYRSIITGTVTPMQSLKEAEAVKVVENSFRDINIAFVNELARSFSQLGIDVVNVINGAATKPFAFMPHYPGCGVGGHCIPVDPYYLIEHAKKNGFEHAFLGLARRINNEMPEFAIKQLGKALAEVNVPLANSTVAVLGVSYKPGVSDDRESPTYKIISLLNESEVSVRIFDPYVTEASTAASLDEALEGVDAVIIATAHEEFKKISPDFFLTKGVKVLVDGRNALPKEDFVKAGIIYKGIGR